MEEAHQPAEIIHGRDDNGKADNNDDKSATAAAAEGSIHGFESLHRLLEANLKPELFQVLFPQTLFILRVFFDIDSSILPYLDISYSNLRILV